MREAGGSSSHRELDTELMDHPGSIYLCEILGRLYLLENNLSSRILGII